MSDYELPIEELKLTVIILLKETGSLWELHILLEYCAWRVAVMWVMERMR
jgi:hypothetical protein